MKLFNHRGRRGMTVRPVGIKRAAAVLVLLACSSTGFAIDSCQPDKISTSGTSTGTLCDAVRKHEDGFNDCTAASPDKNLAVCAKEDKETPQDTLLTHVYVDKGRTLRQLAVYDDLGPSYKPVWSPDSSKFAFTYTTGGLPCCWYVDVFDVTTGRHHLVSRFAQKDMKARLKCGFSNTYAAYWRDSKSLVIWLEGREPDFCKGEEHDRAYRVDAGSGAILERYDGPTTQKIRKSAFGE